MPVQVAQLSAYVAEHSAYHHGETSLASTIVGLAQDFVGSNNINLLFPSGQFGTRLQGGKDAASSRYIYTRLAPLTRHLFNEADDALLNYLNEEGQNIEPDWCGWGGWGQSCSALTSPCGATEWFSALCSLCSPFVLGVCQTALLQIGT